MPSPWSNRVVYLERGFLSDYPNHEQTQAPGHSVGEGGGWKENCDIGEGDGGKVEECWCEFPLPLIIVLPLESV